MALYLLSRNDDIGYDEYVAKVVRAKNESEAREFANADTGDEGKIWISPDKVTIELIESEGKAQVILSDFNAG